MDLVRLVGRVILVVAVGGAGLSKIGARSRLVEAIAGYRLVPAWMAVRLGRWIPIAEVATAFLLAVGVCLTGAALFSAACMTAFAAAMAVNLLQGRRIACGCSGNSSSPSSWPLVARNLFLAAIAVIVATTPSATGHFAVVPPGTAVPSGDVLGEAAVVLATCNSLLVIALLRHTRHLHHRTRTLHTLTRQAGNT
ncbi:MauE/DoxX family redox-associated membrane protein [Streptomyces violascens]|uniref:MauE/DoxX family redox-associated membrane protein n=1 Tax=Streptomyces violascens TaxID=67381 RepID=UPI003687C981